MPAVDTTPIAIYLVGVNLLAFAAFGIDKTRARRGEWRISEASLVLLAAIGGSVGALAGMHAFHHKTRKPLFRFGMPVLFALHIALAIGLLAQIGFLA